MTQPPFRRPMGARDAAEAAFKSATAKPETGKAVAGPAGDPAPKPVALPGMREQVTLRIDQDVLEHFRAAGPGWQDRLNEALRRVVKG